MTTILNTPSLQMMGKTPHVVSDPRAYIESKSIPEPNSGCWLWLGALSHKGAGYGCTTLVGFRQNHHAHRLSYTVYKGPIPDGLLVCHRCDVPSCVNPDHLWLGTPAQNMRDMRQKGRQPKLADRCPHGHPFEGENLGWKQSSNRPRPYRVCIECRRSSARNRRASA